MKITELLAEIQYSLESIKRIGSLNSEEELIREFNLLCSENSAFSGQVALLKEENERLLVKIATLQKDSDKLADLKRLLL